MEQGQGIIMVVGVIFVGQRIRNNGVYGGKPQMLAERTLMLELNKIYTGDCLEIMRDMPDKCVDLVLTDPPYGLNFRSARPSEDKKKDFIANDKAEDLVPLIQKTIPQL